jgi:hypothetical protein
MKGASLRPTLKACACQDALAQTPPPPEGQWQEEIQGRTCSQRRYNARACHLHRGVTTAAHHDREAHWHGMSDAKRLSSM